TLVGPDSGYQFLRSLNASRIPYEVVANSFQKVIDNERAEMRAHRLYSRAGFDYEKTYHTYEEIVAELTSISSPKAKYASIGQTYQKRDIPSITITNPGGSGKKAIFLECGIHAREWVTTAACLWIANELITKTDYDTILNKYEIIIVPTLNSDGYVYTHTSNRNWRKTRSQNGLCYGADPNRNWDASWCSAGASSSPCSDTYCGTAAFSEIEAKNMAALVTAKRGNVAAYFSVHSYSQLWMYPWGYKTASPSNAKQLDDLSALGVNAIKAVNGLTFTKGTIANTICSTYDKEGVTIAFALELRDKGAYGFVLPADQILPASKETWAGIKAVIDGLPA
ncbi:unnamed protein product, partial [Oppiella nova]